MSSTCPTCGAPARELPGSMSSLPRYEPVPDRGLPVEIVVLTVEVEVREDNLWRCVHAHRDNLLNRVRKAVADYPDVVSIRIRIPSEEEAGT